MIEALILSLALACPQVDFPAAQEIHEATLGMLPAHMTRQERDLVFGEPAPVYETAAPVDEWVTWRVVVDPAYSDQRECFWETVNRILSDERSWPWLREAQPDETPQIYIRLASPASCVTWRHSCARGARGSGIVDINIYPWVAGADASREFIINHEVGHLLGMGHEECIEVGPSVMNPSFTSCGAESWPNPMQRLLSMLIRPTEPLLGITYPVSDDT